MGAGLVSAVKPYDAQALLSCVSFFAVAFAQWRRFGQFVAVAPTRADDPTVVQSILMAVLHPLYKNHLLTTRKNVPVL